MNDYEAGFAQQEFRVNQVGKESGPNDFTKKRDNHMSSFFRTGNSIHAPKLSMTDEEEKSSRSGTGMSEKAKEELM